MPTRKPHEIFGRRRSRRTARRWFVGLVVTLGVVVLGAGAVVAVNALLGTWRPEPVAITAGCVASTSAGSAWLEPEQAANSALIAAVGQARGMSPRAVTIALATAMQESKLRNLDHGDRDSLGLFQQRPSQDWGTAEEIMDPLYSAAEFYRALSAVPDFENMEITDAAQAVQRSAYPEAYAQHEPEARSLASALTGHSPAGLTCALPAAQGGEGPEAFQAQFRAEWGDSAAQRTTVLAGDAAAADGRAAVVLRGGSDTQAWAYAAWAVAKAQSLGVGTVQVGGRLWDRASGTWDAAPTPSPPGAETAGEVLVRLA
jgi:hypothetical protein